MHGQDGRRSTGLRVAGQLERWSGGRGAAVGDHRHAPGRLVDHDLEEAASFAIAKAT